MHDNITLSIPAERAFEYQKAILAVLAKVEVAALSGVEGKAISKEHIKTVYELLKELNTEQFSINKPV